MAITRSPRNPAPRLAARASGTASRSNSSFTGATPSRERAWEYVFWVDADAAVDDPGCAAALEELRAETEMVRIAGSYPRAREA